jgi:hypothetical protein
MEDKKAKVGCMFIHLNREAKDPTKQNEYMTGTINFMNDSFFAPNAINSFKKYHPDVEIIYITNNNLDLYLKKLNITEYYENITLLRVHLIKELLKQKFYSKIIMLGIDTFTSSYLDEFINNSTDDIICSSGPPYSFLKTQYWEPQIIQVEHEGKIHLDVSFINADVTCFNSAKGAEMAYNTSLEYWTEHCEQGGLNYCYLNQKELDLKVSIVDFPYVKADSLYNVRSKGAACGGSQMRNGKVWSGNYKDPNSTIIGEVYPTYTYYVKDNKLYTSDHKQIKVFHYCENLGNILKEEYDSFLDEIKTKWFNAETIDFLINKCDCKF